MGNKIITEADRRATPPSKAPTGVTLTAGVGAALLAELLALASGQGHACGRLGGRRGAAVGFGDDLVAHENAPERLKFAEARLGHKPGPRVWPAGPWRPAGAQRSPLR